MRNYLILLSVLLVAGCASNRPNASSTGPGVNDAAFGTVLPFGEIARVCGANSPKLLGFLQDQAPATGHGYALYDSNPNSRGAHTFYVTGFKDKCPRQFTASVAVFGSPNMYEQLRYGPNGKLVPPSGVNDAYEGVKSSVCRVGKNMPCGPKMDKLEQSTVFISTYETFTGSARWSDVLLHNGKVAAAKVQAP